MAGKGEAFADIGYRFVPDFDGANASPLQDNTIANRAKAGAPTDLPLKQMAQNHNYWRQ